MFTDFSATTIQLRVNAWALALLSLMCFALKHFADGQIDPSFDPGVDIDGPVYALARQTTGALLIGGSFKRYQQLTNIALARLRENGEADPLFQSPFVHTNDQKSLVTCLITFPDDSALVGGDLILGKPPAGATTNRFSVVRVTRNGTLDESFSPFSSAFIYSMGLQQDGSVVICLSGTNSPSLLRLKPNGELDNTFKAIPRIQGGHFEPATLLIEADDSIVAGGRVGFYGNLMLYSAAIVRFKKDGELDASFATPVIGGSLVRAIARDFDGNLMVGGLFWSWNGFPVTNIARLRSDGTHDRSFVPSQTSPVRTIALDNSGKILAGSAQLDRWNSNGTYDKTLYISPVSAGDVRHIATMMIVDDSRLLIGGEFQYAGPAGRTRLARIFNSGEIDESFDVGNGLRGAVVAMDISPDQSILVGGQFDNSQPGSLLRFARNGVRDRTFQPKLPFRSGIRSIVSQPDGRMLVGSIGGELIRLEPNGNVDESFKLRVPSLRWGQAALVENGRILLAGVEIAGDFVLRIYRLNSDGTEDTSFDAPDFPQLTSGQIFALPLHLLSLAHGKITLAGMFGLYDRNRGGWGLVELNANDGSLLRSVSLTLPSDLPEVFSLQPDGSVIIASSKWYDHSSAYVGRARPDGSLDQSFLLQSWFNHSITQIIPADNRRVFVAAVNYAQGEIGEAFVVRLNPDGRADNSFFRTSIRGDRSSGSRIGVLKPDETGGLYLAGNFVSVHGFERVNLARLVIERQAALTIQKSSEGLAVSWPAEIGAYNLQEAESLSNAIWRKVSAQPARAGRDFFLKINPDLSSGFYRLQSTTGAP